jgi:hypothetical protein
MLTDNNAVQTNPEYTTGALLLGAPFAVSSGSDKNGLIYGILAGYNFGSSAANTNRSVFSVIA